MRKVPELEDCGEDSERNRAIYLARMQGETYKVLARKFHLSTSRVRSIVCKIERRIFLRNLGANGKVSTR